ncbi:MAG: ribonucleotide reductase N-terminal alpha domain-containing protein [Candidatus Hodarchaeota archaeon]
MIEAGTTKANGIKSEQKIILSKNALKVLERRYLAKDEEGNVLETPVEMFRRVAKNIAVADTLYGHTQEEVKQTEKEFFQIIAKLEFLPNSPTLMNAGRELQQLSACFVLPIEDSTESIFDAVKYAALVHKSGGGTGFSFSRLRPKNDRVRSTGGIASGPVSFMKVFNVSTEVIKQGGTRRGANMAILRVDNPDILDFITSKKEVEAFTNFNISVALTEEFMKALKENQDYNLINPRTKEIVSQLNAKYVWDLIVEMAWKTGEPGIVFMDRINAANPTPLLGEIEATNPCVTGDTWVTTDKGPAMVRDIIGVPTSLLLDGAFHTTTKTGFFSTGVKDVYEVQTNRGYHIKATADHLVRVAICISRDAIESDWKPVSNLKPGDNLVLSNNRVAQWNGMGSYDEGYLLGMLLGDGTLKKETAVISVWGNGTSSQSIRYEVECFAHTMPHRSDFNGFLEIKDRGEYRLKSKSLQKLALEYGMTPGDKVMSPEIETTNVEFHKGFLRGLFDADGSVLGTIEKGWSVRLSQSNLDTLKAVQRMLHRFGIASTIYENRRSEGSRLMPDGNGGYRYYANKAQHELVISRDNMAVFAETIGFADAEKQKKLLDVLSALSRGPYRERFIAEVSQITPLGCEEVFDVQIPSKNAFSANGLYVHNCGEQPLLPYESCNLGSINVGKLVQKNVYGVMEINFEKLRSVVRTAVHFLDNVIDVNEYPLPEIEKITKGNRKIGLGIMGFADMLIKLGIPYDSLKAIEIAEELMCFISNEARKKSQELAEDRGAFPNFKRSIYDKPGHPLIRNATVTTIAPTGTLGIIANCSSGIEPLFSVAYVRNVLENEQLIEVNDVFKKILTEKGIYSEELIRKIAEKKGIQDVEGLPQDIKDLFVTAHEISPIHHIRIQAAFQKYVDNAVSKTVNLNSNMTKTDVKEVFNLAYELGCKGVTVYRDGSRPNQVLSTNFS